MPRRRLTEEMVRLLKPTKRQTIRWKDDDGKWREDRQVDFFDTASKGLVLRFSYGGAKTWRALHYVDGKPKTHKLGRHPGMSLKQAREAAAKFLEDPQKALAEPEAKPLTFGEVTIDFLKRHVAASGLRSRPEIERCLNRYVLPRWQDRPFLDIRRGDVAKLLDEIEDTHGARQADYVLAIIRKLMNWYQARHDDYVSPVVKGMGRSNPSASKRKRILDDNEICALWNACEGTFGDVVKLLLLTGQRREKVGTMRWADIVDGEWRIPSDAREKANAGSLRLPQAALEIIKARPRFDGNPHVFVGLRGKLQGRGPFNSYSQRKEELDKRLPDMPPWTLHDLRRTARSLMSRAGVRPDVAERVLGHAIPGIEGVYDRHSYYAEKAEALNRLSALVARIVSGEEGGNVIPIRDVAASQ